VVLHVPFEYMYTNVSRPEDDPCRNELELHTTDFMVTNKLLLVTLKTFAHCTHSLQATWITWYFQLVCFSTTVCAPTNTSSLVLLQSVILRTTPDTQTRSLTGVGNSIRWDVNFHFLFRIESCFYIHSVPCCL
jgi:hypothetical protein